MLNLSQPEKEITIVIVEDEDGHAYLIQKNLKRGGVSSPMVHLKNGQEAIEYFNGNEVRGIKPLNLDSTLVLLDLNMPMYDGFAVLEYIRDIEKIKNIPIMILSSTTRQHEIKRCYDLGCSIFLNKPIDYASFSEAMVQLGSLIKIVKVQT